MFRYVPRTIPTNIFVIGCGGTGSRLVPLLAQFMKTVTAGVSPRGTVVSPVIYLIDDDVVEEKNLQRQNFIAADVGKSKAEVLAQRYSRAYGVNLVPVVKRVSPTSSRSGQIPQLFGDLTEVPRNPGVNSLVIMCVDSAQARRDIIKVWSNSRMDGHTHNPDILPVFIDAGNEDDYGQVRIFQRVGVPEILAGEDTPEPKLRPATLDIHCLPMDIEFYEGLKDNVGGSCADLDQTLAINALMATLIMGLVQNLYYLKPFTYHSMSISLSGSVEVGYLTAEYLSGLARRKGSLEKYGWCEQMMAWTQYTGMRLAYIQKNLDMLREMGLDQDGNLLPVTANGQVDDKGCDEDEEESAEEPLVDASASEESELESESGPLEVPEGPPPLRVIQPLLRQPV